MVHQENSGGVPVPGQAVAHLRVRQAVQPAARHPPAGEHPEQRQGGQRQACFRLRNAFVIHWGWGPDGRYFENS